MLPSRLKQWPKTAKFVTKGRPFSPAVVLNSSLPPSRPHGCFFLSRPRNERTSAQVSSQEKRINVHHKSRAHEGAPRHPKNGQTTQGWAVSGKPNWTEASLRMLGNAGRSARRQPLNKSAGSSLVGHHKVTKKRPNQNTKTRTRKHSRPFQKRLVKHLICAPAHLGKRAQRSGNYTLMTIKNTVHLADCHVFCCEVKK